MIDNIGKEISNIVDFEFRIFKVHFKIVDNHCIRYLLECYVKEQINSKETDRIKILLHNQFL